MANKKSFTGEMDFNWTDVFRFDVNWFQVFYNLAHLLFAYLLALPVAINRELNHKSVGFRTYPLVSLASCGFMLVGVSLFDNQQALSRIIYGVATGMGFIGGGAILKDGGEAHGLSAAASLWCTGVIGVSVAVNLHEIATLLSIAIFLTFVTKNAVKKQTKK